MKRKFKMANNLEYDRALKKVSLVERNPNPNGTKILNLNTISIHQSKDIIELATQISKADEAIKNNVTGKLGVILEQIEFLQGQAAKILRESSHNTTLHHVPCNFQKLPGKIYHAYQRPSGQVYFSMLSPEEWGTACTHEFIGSHRLEPDQSWTSIDKIREKSKINEWTQNLMSSEIRGDRSLDTITEMES